MAATGPGRDTTGGQPACARPQAASQATPPAATAAIPAPSFPAAVEQVIVDVVVTDKKGNPITGLKTRAT